MKKQEGLAIARLFRDALHSQGYPIERVVLFGSVAQNRATEDSDLDIAVVCSPFAPTRHEENMALRRVRRAIDVRIEPFCLHADEYERRTFALAWEIASTGVEV